MVKDMGQLQGDYFFTSTSARTNTSSRRSAGQLIGAHTNLSVLVKYPSKTCWSWDRSNIWPWISRARPPIADRCSSWTHSNSLHKYCTVSSRSPPVTKKLTQSDEPTARSSIRNSPSVTFVSAPSIHPTESSTCCTSPRPVCRLATSKRYRSWHVFRLIPGFGHHRRTYVRSNERCGPDDPNIIRTIQRRHDPSAHWASLTHPLVGTFGHLDQLMAQKIKGISILVERLYAG
jgi:hypothetical protein